MTIMLKPRFPFFFSGLNALQHIQDKLTYACNHITTDGKLAKFQHHCCFVVL